MGAAGGAAAAAHAGRSSHAVRQPGAGRPRRGGQIGDEPPARAATEPIGRVDQGIGTVHGQADAAFPGRPAHGRTDGVTVGRESSSSHTLNVSYVDGWNSSSTDTMRGESPCAWWWRRKVSSTWRFGATP